MSSVRRQLEMLHRSQAPAAPAAPAPRVEEGPFHLRRWEYPADHAYGSFPLLALRELAAEWLERLGLAGFDPHSALFFDTETTGLAGGTGTYAFLIGLGWFEGGSQGGSPPSQPTIVLEQLLMRDFSEEAAVLAHVGQRLSRCGGLVSFNGKTFDAQLLQTRFLMKRLRYSLEELPHFDLLHPSRRVWGASFDDCKLSTLEEQVLGVRRPSDIPGWLIPRLYFSFLRSRSTRSLERVIDHNRRDLLALMGLVGALRHCLESPFAPRTALEDLALGRWLEELGLQEEGWQLIERAVCATLPPEFRRTGKLRLARLKRRSGDRQGAADLWAEVLGENPCDPEASEELAKYLEHHGRNVPAALGLVESVLTRRDLSRSCRRRFEDRRQRLLRLSVAASGPQ